MTKSESRGVTLQLHRREIKLQGNNKTEKNPTRDHKNYI